MSADPRRQPPERLPRYARNTALEAHIDRLKDALAPAEAAAALPAAPQRPVVFIVGPGRSGTTLALQWLAASGAFAYPSNLIARLYSTPYTGALIHRLLADPELDYRGEFDEVAPFNSQSDLHSDTGKTQGLAAPNVFWYFWYHFFPFGDPPALTQQQWESGDSEGFLRGLAGLEAGFDGRPVVLKGMIANWNIAALNALVPKALFLHMRRDPYFTMQSIVQTRERFFGHRRQWWSFRPPEFDWLQARNVYEQVAGQVYFTHRALERAQEEVSADRWLSVDYEAFCRDPAMVYAQIDERFRAQGDQLSLAYTGPTAFDCGNEQRLSSADEKALRDAYAALAG